MYPTPNFPFYKIFLNTYPNYVFQFFFSKFHFHVDIFNNDWQTDSLRKPQRKGSILIWNLKNTKATYQNGT